MHRLRAEVFAGRLGWDVKVVDGQEIDEFDALDDVHYLIAKGPGGIVNACWRLLPTTGPNMLANVFPELLGGATAPASSDCWELSRFAVAADRLDNADSAGTHQIGFGELSVALMAESTKFAQAHGIARYVTVTTAAIERLLRKQGVNVHRLAAPLRIGNVLAVACFIEIDDITRRALGR